VTADSAGPQRYFPEYYLCRWFRQRGEEVSVFAFERTGFKAIAEAYRAVIGHLQVDTVILVDGGTDSLMRGDEAGLGTPEEDMVSIAAVDESNVDRKILASIGFGVDSFHGVCHAHALEALADLTRQGAFLGAFSLVREMPEVQQYIEAIQAVHEAMTNHPSIVCSSILSALDGHYGDFHRTRRTRGSTLWINPLMTMYWCFRLDLVARRVLYLDAIKETQTEWDLIKAIDTFRKGCTPIRNRTSIPDNSFDHRVSR
jgi:hypothetical protein